MSAVTAYTIEYQYGSYSGEWEVVLSDDEVDAGVDPVEVMWGQMRRRGLLTLSMAHSAARVTSERRI